MHIALEVGEPRGANFQAPHFEHFFMHQLTEACSYTGPAEP